PKTRLSGTTIAATSNVSRIAASATGSEMAATYAAIPPPSAWANTRISGVTTNSTRNTRLMAMSAIRTYGEPLTRQLRSGAGSTRALAPVETQVAGKQAAQEPEERQGGTHRRARIVELLQPRDDQ